MYRTVIAMKPWVKVGIIAFCLVEISVGVFVGNRILQQKKANVLGSVIDKELNMTAGLSKLTYYYEPIANSTEIDKTRWVNGQVTFTYNLDTLNDRFNYLLEKPATTYRIIALGDSFTFGDHVNTKDSWPEQLEDMLNARRPCTDYIKYEVLNLGLRGFDIQNEVERYRLRGGKYHPDLVVWLLMDNDFTEVRELSLGRAMEIREEEMADNTIDVNNEWYKPVEIATRELHKKYTNDQIYRMQDGFFVDFSSLYNGKLIIAAFPALPSRDKNHMKQWVSVRSDTSVDDALPDLDADAQLTVQDGHPSVLGHTKIAEHLYAYLLTGKIIPCSKP